MVKEKLSAILQQLQIKGYSLFERAKALWWNYRQSTIGIFLNWKGLGLVAIMLSLPVGLYLSQHTAIFTQQAAGK